MITLKYSKKNHQKIIHACIVALLDGKTVVYPTETSYGIACDPASKKGLQRLYQIKGRPKKKPIHVIPPSIAFVKQVVQWNATAQKLAKKFWPGSLTLVLPLISKASYLHQFAAQSGFLGIRMPANIVASDLAKKLGRAIPGTSANVSGQPDCYSADDIVAQYRRKKYKPDILIDAGRLLKRKPSTVAKVSNDFV
jgi:L-threonylcarbamoyladenylate synthase